MSTTLILQQDVLYVHTLFIEQKEQHWHSQERGVIIMHTLRLWARNTLLLAMMLTLSLSACDWFTLPPPPPPKISRPIIFLHGVNQDASKMGVPLDKTSNNTFVPLIQ